VLDIIHVGWSKYCYWRWCNSTAL